MPRPSIPLEPRKTPVQARSAHTVQAIHTACVQVLLDGGLDRLTTSRVAARAGVSVGSLYQYFPNKHSLLASVLEQHLLKVVEAVEQGCQRAKGRPVAAMAEALVRAVFEAKFAQADSSRALYAVAAEVGGAAVVTQLAQRAQLALREMLATAADRRFTDLALMGFVLSTSLVGSVQALLESSAPAPVVAGVQAELAVMVAAYLGQVGTGLIPSGVGSSRSPTGRGATKRAPRP